MKKLLLSFLCAATLTGAAYAQTQTLSLQDSLSNLNSGTYNSTSTFTINIVLSITGYNTGGVFKADGLSYWLQTNSALAPFISITSNTYFTFTDSSQPTVPKTFTDAAGANPGFLSDEIVSAGQTGDLGATAAVAGEDRTDGTYQVTQLTFTLANAPTGMFTIATTTLGGKASSVNDTPAFNSFDIPQSNYTLTVVPEPSTWSFLALGGLGSVGLMLLRRRRVA